jgi:hypothetical protein
VRRLEAAGAHWLASMSGVLALDGQSGRALFDAPAETRPLGESFFIDGGEFRFGACHGPTYGSEVFATCGDSLVYFNGSTALLIDTVSRRELARGRFVAQSRTGGHNVRTEIPLGGQTLELDGFILGR